MASKWELLGDQIAVQAAHLDAATHQLLTDLRAFDRSGTWVKQGARTCAAWLSWRVGWGRGKAREHVRVATRLGDLPLIDEALRKGEVSYCKVRAMTRVATAANEAHLLEDARHATGAQLEILCRKYAMVVRGAQPDGEGDERARRTVWRRDLVDGMVEIRATLHAEEAAVVWAALDRLAREQCRTGAADEVAAPTSSDASSTPGFELMAILERADCRGVVEQDDDDGGDHAAQPRTAASHRESEAAETEAALVDGVDGTERGDGAAPTTVATAIEASPEEAEVWRAQDTPCDHAGSVPRERAVSVFDRADALVAMAQGVLRGTRIHRSPTELVVTVSAETLRAPAEAADPIAALADGTCVSAEAARRLACDCGVVHATEDADGRTLSVGRRTRSIPASIKRAMLRRDQHCRFPGCTNRLFVEGHHIEHWAAGGETSLRNIVAMCHHHHRFVHEYGYRVELDEAQQPGFFDPHGRAVRDVPDRPRCPELGWPAIHASNAGLGITERTNECRWDGTPIQWPFVIDALVHLDRRT